MHRCSSSQGNMVGPCTCGMFHSPGNCFSMLFSMPNHKPFDEADMYGFTASSSSASSVDCTLSLGTPSTRLTNADSSDQKRSHHYDHRSSSCMPNFYWDILQPKSTTPYPPSKSGRGSSANNSGCTSDPLLARRCANCDTTSTPLWRNGPRGPKSLCNACGIRFKKEERRAAAAAAAAATTSNGGAASGMMEAQHMMSQQGNSWSTQYHSQTQTQKMGCFSPGMGNEFRFIDDDEDRDADSGIPFLSWRLNVTDRPSIVHDFTR